MRPLHTILSAAMPVLAPFLHTESSDAESVVPAPPLALGKYKAVRLGPHFTATQRPVRCSPTIPLFVEYGKLGAIQSSSYDPHSPSFFSRGPSA